MKLTINYSCSEPKCSKCSVSGEEIAFYFGWMNFYSTCIILPTVIGLAMYVLRPKDTTVDTDPYLPFFSVIMAIWAVLFLVVSVPRHVHYYVTG